MFIHLFCNNKFQNTELLYTEAPTKNSFAVAFDLF